jgi:hypothetical protein
MQFQAPESIMMIRPSNFGYNPLTAKSNVFQVKDTSNSPGEISRAAQQEFDRFHDLLITHNVDVIVMEDQPGTVLPDSVFPNNWISFHHDGTVVLYPMMAQNRRLERRMDILPDLQNKYGFNIIRILDYTNHEADGQYLEGTGSVVFDYVNRIAYANHSDRTDEFVFRKLCSDLDYKGIFFQAADPSGNDIYHTNVMMCLGTKFVVICLDTIPNESMRLKLLQSFEETGHEVIDINFRQLNHFAGNMIEVSDRNKEPVIIMSQSAYHSLSTDQTQRLSDYGTILYSPIPIIQNYGGGSVRCMIAGIYLPTI